MRGFTRDSHIFLTLCLQVIVLLLITSHVRAWSLGSLLYCFQCWRMNFLVQCKQMSKELINKVYMYGTKAGVVDCS